MKVKLTTYDIGYIIRKYRLKSVEDFRKYGLVLRKIGEGCSRTVYGIVGYPSLVVKLISQTGPSSKRHSKNEIRAYKRLTNRKTKKYKKLWVYTPKIYAWSEDGVILMKRYRPCGYGNKYRKRIAVARNITGYLFPYNDGTDIYGENTGVDEKGNLKFLDLGCFFEW